VINDIFYDLDLINTGFYVPFGLVLFLFFQSLILSIRFTNAFNRVESLSLELSQKNLEIEEYSKDLELKVKQRTETIFQQKENLERQIRMAQKIQVALLPKSMPNMKGIALSFEYRPMMGVGGDFFDYFIKNKNEMGLFICDVSGHGVSSAFLASMVKMSLNQWQTNLNKPKQILYEIYDSLQGKMSGHFVTAFAIYINLITGKLICSNAGHPPQLIIRKNGEIEMIQSRGRLIGEDFPPNYSEITTSLTEGDKLVLYTDGITEARDPQGKLLGDQGFFTLVKENLEKPAEIFCQNIMKGLIQYRENKEFFDDDITLMVMDYK
jgi:serine phosphatase RsbU (regulator of sigma subunit)